MAFVNEYDAELVEVYFWFSNDSPYGAFEVGFQTEFSGQWLVEVKDTKRNTVKLFPYHKKTLIPSQKDAAQALEKYLEMIGED